MSTAKSPTPIHSARLVHNHTLHTFVGRLKRLADNHKRLANAASVGELENTHILYEAQEKIVEQFYTLCEQWPQLANASDVCSRCGK